MKRFLIPAMLFLLGTSISTAQMSCWYDIGYDLDGKPVTYTFGDPCDDCTMEVELGFDFNLYGTHFDELWMSSNGCVTFGWEWMIFTPDAFPNILSIMVAPFHADSDFRGSGKWAYYVDTANEYAIFTWENAPHYYGYSAGLENSYQLVIFGTETTKSGFPGKGNNTCFQYMNMDWTVGDASGGTLGHGGVPAFAGLNKGDGFTGMEYGTFDGRGKTYDASTGTDNVDYLDSSCVCFDAEIGYLPVTMVEFDANLLGDNMVRLNWLTAEELNCSHYIIERAGSDMTWSVVGEVTGSGSTPSATAYEWIDTEPCPGDNYYRIIQYDYDGSFEVYGPEHVEVIGSSSSFDIIEILPVPADDHLEVSIHSDSDEAMSLRIMDMTGRVIHEEIYEIDNGYNELYVDLGEISVPGTYMLAIEKNGSVLHRKFIKH